MVLSLVFRVLINEHNVQMDKQIPNWSVGHIIKLRITKNLERIWWCWLSIIQTLRQEEQTNSLVSVNHAY